MDKILGYDPEDTIIIVSLYNHHEEIRKQILELGWKGDLVIAKEEMKELKSLEFYLFIRNMTKDCYHPEIVNIELSGTCNCKCVYCVFHGIQNIKKEQKGLMEWNILEKVVSQIKQIPTVNTISTVGGGEVFIHPQWFEMTQYMLKETKVKNFIMYTNGMLLTKENIKKIMMLDVQNIQLDVSIDGRSAEDNDKYRKGSVYEIIKKNIRMMMEEKENTEKNISVLITNCYILNENEIELLRKEKFVVEPPMYLREDFPEIKIISKPTYVNYNKHKDDRRDNLCMKEIKHTDNSVMCTNLFNRIAVNNRGELLRCSCGYAGVEAVASVKEHNIYDAWKTDIQMNEARNDFITGEKSPEMCEGCPGIGIGSYYVMVEQ